MCAVLTRGETVFIVFSLVTSCLQNNEEIGVMEKEMSMMLESAGLFEVNVPDFKQLKQCRKEIKLLKTLWDYIVIVRWVAAGTITLVCDCMIPQI